MGAGLAQVGILLLLTVIGLPLFFFGLMAALDHFERTLSSAPRTVPPAPGGVGASAGIGAVAAVQPPAIKADADVLTLPTAPIAAPTAASNSAAAG